MGDAQTKNVTLKVDFRSTLNLAQTLETDSSCSVPNLGNLAKRFKVFLKKVKLFYTFCAEKNLTLNIPRLKADQIN